MAVVVVFGALWTAAPLINAQGKRTFTLEGEVQTSSAWSHFPQWNAGQLVGWEGDYTDAPVLYTIDRNGRRDEFLFTIPDAKYINVYDVAIGRDSEIAVVGNALTADERGTMFVARISVDRKRQTVTRVWPYCPIKATVAADRSVWTIGRLKNDEGTRDVAEPVLRRYGDAGEMLSSTKVDTRGYYALGMSYLCAAHDRVGWFTTSDDPATPGEYIEFSLDGREIGRHDGPEGTTYREISGVALSKDNDLVAGIIGGRTREFVALDRASRTWITVSLPPAPSWSWVLGFDGATLVTMAEDGKLRRFKTN